MINNKIKKKIAEIPPTDEWWSSSGKEVFFTLAEKLIAKGFSSEETIDILNNAYYAVATEYGD